MLGRWTSRQLQPGARLERVGTPAPHTTLFMLIITALPSETESLNIAHPHSDAQNESAWKAKTVMAGT